MSLGLEPKIWLKIMLSDFEQIQQKFESMTHLYNTLQTIAILDTSVGLTTLLPDLDSNQDTILQRDVSYH